MPGRGKVQIVFAPLPEEERNVERSAAKEFALRTAAKFDAESLNIEIVHLVEWKKEPLIDCSITDSFTSFAVVFFISCGSDGTVHRSVRKITKWMKEQETKLQTACGSETTGSKNISVGIALLGYSVCKTSAEQMEDEVYSSGRRFAKSLKAILCKSRPQSFEPMFLLETQVELEPPEETLDGWIQALVDSLPKQVE